MSTERLAETLMRRQARDAKTGDTVPDKWSHLAARRMLDLTEENKTLKSMIREALVDMNPERDARWLLRADEYKMRRVWEDVYNRLLRRAKAVQNLRRFPD